MREPSEVRQVSVPGQDGGRVQGEEGQASHPQPEPQSQSQTAIRPEPPDNPVAKEGTLVNVLVGVLAGVIIGMLVGELVQDGG